MRLPHSFILLVLAALANSSITNTTVDDTSSSFTFDGAWSAITPTSPCDICSSKPDPSQTQGGTWHDGNCRTGAPTTTTGSFTFQGSAIYIFGIDQAISQPNIVFTLGNVQQTHHYTGTESFAYHALFFSATGLAADQMHTVNWVFNVDDSTGVEVQAALFDYAVVTSGEEDAAPTPTPTAKSPTTTTTSRPTTSAKTSIRSSTRFSAGAHPVSSSSQAPVSALGQSTSSVSLSTSSTSPYPTALNSTVTVSDGSTTVTAQSAVARSAKSNLGPIIGAVLGALALAALVILFLFFRSRRARRVRAQTDKAARSQFLRIEDYPLQNVRPPPDTREVQNSAPASLAASNSKRGGYLNTHQGPSTATLLPSQAPAPDAPPHEDTSTDSHRSRSEPDTGPSTAGTDGPTTTTRDLRFLEERLATLEAQVAVQQHPPPYVHDD